MDFLKICTLITHYLKMYTWNFHIDWIIFSPFKRLFSVFGPFIARNSVFKVMKNFELKIENVLFLN